MGETNTSRRVRRRELIEQPVISRDEFRQAFHAIQRFHLTELRDDHRGACGFELPRP